MMKKTNNATIRLQKFVKSRGHSKVVFEKRTHKDYHRYSSGRLEDYSY